MTAHDSRHPARVSAARVPQQTRRSAAVLSARIVRQLEAIDAWNAASRVRESGLVGTGRTRAAREDATRQIDAMRRTHQTITARAAAELARDPGPLLLPAATAVIAHRHAWFAERLAALVEARGVTVLECTDNGPDALGVVIAEQPNVVLIGDCLAMMTCDNLVTEIRRFAPVTVLAVQTNDVRQARTWLTRADAVFRHHAPGAVADALGAHCLTRRPHQAHDARDAYSRHQRPVPA